MKIFLDCQSRTPTVSIGTQAFIISSMQIIKHSFGNVEFIILSSHPELENSYLSKEALKYRLIKRNDSQLGTIKNIRKIMNEVDIVVSALGDGYVASSTSPSRMFLKTLFFKRPAVLFPSSIGPFPNGLKLALAKKGLKKYDFIMARDTVTFEDFKKIGFKDITLVPDTAFILEPANKDRIDTLLAKENIPTEKQYVGLNISQLLNCLYRENLNINYPKFMAELVIYINKISQSHVLLIPHQIYPECYKCNDPSLISSKDGDDRIAIREIMNYLPDKSIFTPVLGEYSAREYKGLIGRCEAFIGGRMHSVIGALSMEIPSIIIQYSHKAPGMMQTLGLQEQIWDYRGSPDDLKLKIQKLWDSRNVIKQKIQGQMLQYKKDALKAGDILTNIARQYKLIP